MYNLSGLVLLLLSVWLIKVKTKRSYTELIMNNEHTNFENEILLDESRI